MRHDWIFDVLNDLRSYALQNDLPGLAAKVDDALRAASAELRGMDGSGGPIAGGGAGGVPPPGRPH